MSDAKRIQPPKTRPSLVALFHEWNDQFFDGMLPEPRLIWHARLRTSAGRFVPGSRNRGPRHGESGGLRRGLLRMIPRAGQRFFRLPQIEIATYLLDLPQAEHHVRDTMGHEMIHYWLWERGRPYGHTAEFTAKLKLLGVSRYNPVPKISGTSHRYECPGCRRQWVRRKRYGRKVACHKCCKEFAAGKYSTAFELVYLVPSSDTG